MHRLLLRQIQRHLGDISKLDGNCQEFLDAVSTAYEQADNDRQMIEHSLELMSQELTERNRDLGRRLEEKQAVEQALRKSEAVLSRAQQVAHLGSWEWNIIEDRITWSDEVYRIFGIAPGTGALSYESFLTFVHPNDRERLRQAVSDSLTHLSHYSVEHRIVLADGRVKHLHERGEVVADESGRPVEMFGTVHDITERKQVEQLLLKEKEEQAALIKKLNEAHNQLLQSEKMASIGQLAAGVAHEINNPIGYVNSNLGTLGTYVEQLLAILGAYEETDDVLAAYPERFEKIRRLKEEADLAFLTQDLRDLMKESGEGIKRVRQIVQDLKDFSHVDEGEWSWADLCKGLDSTLNVVWNEIKYKAKVVKEYGETPKIQCLASQLNQVFMNLLVNAAHAIDNNGVITLRTGVSNDEVWVEVTDTGSGIPAENLTRIFDPFFTTKPVGKGTGLGLSLAYGIIQKHHGKIEVQSIPGKGTTFRVRLPVQQPEHPAG